MNEIARLQWEVAKILPESLGVLWISMSLHDVYQFVAEVSQCFEAEHVARDYAELLAGYTDDLIGVV